jgi:pyruvate/2-oxoglutarate/acetoin dehydrogenase E1 component
MPKNPRQLKFSQAINEALSQSMKRDKNVIVMGLGVDDPKGVFGTTLNLHKKFPKERVFDLPTSENSFTGFALGLSLQGKKPIIVHQRVEFSLLSIDQIINQAAKWLYMSGGKSNVPLVIRLIIGRGWGQGPQHSQSLETIFAHIPGLKVVCPSTPGLAKGLLNAAIKDKNPVIFFEHRWLHHLVGNVKKNYYTKEIGLSRYVSRGKDLTIITFSYTVIQSLKINKLLLENNISAEIIDLVSLRPLDNLKFLKSAKKTKRVLILDNGWMKYGISSEISAIINEKINFKVKVVRLGNADAPIPSTASLAKFSYPSDINIIDKISMLLKKKIKLGRNFQNKIPSDQPDKNFTGPF